MAFQIIWSVQAREDLRDIVVFIAQDNPRLAESFGYEIISKVDVLAQFPLIGRALPEEQDENIREIIFRPYRIVYQVLAEQRIVAIARVWHGARGKPNLPDQLDF